MNQARYAGAIAVLMLPLGSSKAQPATFVGVGDLPGGTYRSGVYGVSGDGRVAAGGSAGYSGLGGTQAFRWTSESGIVGLGDLPGGSSFSEAADVSPEGEYIVGHSISGAGTEAFLWSQGTGMVGLGDLPGATHASGANAVSEGGSVVVGIGRGVNDWAQAFRWTSAGGMAGLGWLPGTLSNGGRDSQARAVSADGSRVVGQSTFNDGQHVGIQGFLWTPDVGMVGLGDLPGGPSYSVPNAISPDGRFIVGSSDTSVGTEAFLWTEETGMVSLGDLPGGFVGSIAHGVSGDGSAVVGVSDNNAFYWTPFRGMVKLTDILLEHGIDTADMGWTLGPAYGVSADGLTIVGSGRNPNGDGEGWVIRLPAPGALSVGAAAALHTAQRRRKYS